MRKVIVKYLLRHRHRIGRAAGPLLHEHRKRELRLLVRSESDEPAVVLPDGSGLGRPGLSGRAKEEIIQGPCGAVRNGLPHSLAHDPERRGVSDVVADVLGFELLERTTFLVDDRMRDARLPEGATVRDGCGRYR